MFELDNPFLPGLVTLTVIILGIAITMRKRPSGEPAQSKYIIVSIVGVAVVLLIGVAAAMYAANGSI